MPVNVIMPKVAESIFEGTLTKWLKKEGEPVKRDEPLFEISTDKIDTEIPSPVAGVLAKILIKEGETVPINTVVGIITEGKEAAVAVEPAKPTVKPPEFKPVAVESREEKAGVFASPLVTKIAQEESIDLSKITGTGIGGRITKKDVMLYIEKMKEAKEAVARVQPVKEPPKVSTQEVPVAAAGPIETVPMSPMRRKIAEHMVMSRRTSAHVTSVFEVDVSKVVDIREKEREYFETVYETDLTYTPFFATTALNAIKEFPIVNSSVEGDKIIYKKYVNLGIAVALPDGLIVPVIKNADEKSFLGLCRAINDIATRSRTKRLTVDDVQGGTFTITNPGVFGGLFGTPIINQPQVAIMGVGAIHKRPVVINDLIAVRPMVYLTLSFDHRVIDGAVADQFLGKVKSVLENWDIPIK